jgi:PLP dependent protein
MRFKVATIKENVERVRERIAASCLRAVRKPEEVTLVAVSKTVSPEAIRQAYEAGLRDFGENRVQEAAGKRPALSDLTAAWHLIGHLQSNKAKPARELFHWVHSIDSLKLAQKLDQAAACTGERLHVLIQVNLGGEVTKSGVEENDVLPLVGEIQKLETVEIRGLMAIPPFLENPEEVRPYFRRLRELAQKVGNEHLSRGSMEHLSMGMTHDFEVAIEEGATMVRVGTGIFGARI